MAIPIIGKIIDKLIDKGGDIISELVTDKDLAKQLDHAFRSQLSKEAADYAELELQAEQAMFEAQQATVQAELHQSDLYTKRTRPKIARNSWVLTIAYAVFATIGAPLLAYWTAEPEVSGVFSDISFQWEVFMAIASPALTYMGVRSFDKWRLK